MAACRRVPWLAFCGASLLVLAGCGKGPTYPKALVADSIESLLTQEHFAQPAVRFLDHTLAVHIHHPESLSQTNGQIGLGTAFEDVHHKAVQAIHRVLLSTDADAQFYVLLISDPNLPGLYFTIVRYMDDIKRANVNKLDTPEMLARTVFELNPQGPTTLSLEQYVPHDIQLEDFLSWQLARRIQHQLADELQKSGAATVGRCSGTFQGREFAFSLDVVPTTGLPLDEATLQQAFQSSTTVIAKVLLSYKFERFDAVRLIHPATGRSLLLPKAHLDLFR